MDTLLILPQQYPLHKLSGQYENLCECHIEPDWLLIFDFNEEQLIFHCAASHSDLFRKIRK